MDTFKYNKPRLSLDEQLDVLRNRGLIIDDLDKSRNALENNSYFRLAGYWRMMEKDKVTHQFRKGSKFSTIVDYYNFDRELRSLIFEAIQTIEIALRTKIIKHFSDDPFWFMKREYATNLDYFQYNLSKIESEVYRSYEEFVADHFRKYAKPELPPVWKTLEVISFGTMSRLFSNYNDSRAKQNVANEFGHTNFNILRSWIECITILRNCCAHHSRVFYRIFFTKPNLPQKLPNIWISNFDFHRLKLYPHLCVLAYCLIAIDQNSTFVKDLANLLSKYTSVNPYLMGFPKNWEKDAFWGNYLVF